MGRLVESLAPQYGCEVAGIVDPLRGGDGVDSDRWRGVDVAIDFTTAEAVPVNMALLAGRGINVVVGTTGWGSHQRELRRVGLRDAAGWRAQCFRADEQADQGAECGGREAVAREPNSEWRRSTAWRSATFARIVTSS